MSVGGPRGECQRAAEGVGPGAGPAQAEPANPAAPSREPVWVTHFPHLQQGPPWVQGHRHTPQLSAGPWGQWAPLGNAGAARVSGRGPL